jgi:hypothetical protein
VKGRVERPLFDAQGVIGNPLDVKGYAVTMHGLAAEGLQDEENQGALKNIVSGLVHGHSYR